MNAYNLFQRGSPFHTQRQRHTRIVPGSFWRSVKWIEGGQYLGKGVRPVHLIMQAEPHLHFYLAFRTDSITICSCSMPARRTHFQQNYLHFRLCHESATLNGCVILTLAVLPSLFQQVTELRFEYNFAYSFFFMKCRCPQSLRIKRSIASSKLFAYTFWKKCWTYWWNVNVSLRDFLKIMFSVALSSHCGRAVSVGIMLLPLPWF